MGKRRDETAPRIDPLVLLDLDTGDADALVPGASLQGERFEHVALGDLRALALDGCELVDALGSEVRLEAGRLRESVLDRLDVTTMTANGSVWRDVRITGSRIGAAEWFDVEWRAVELIGCRIGYLNLAGARLQDVRFTDCVLDELDLRAAEARRIAFDGCRVAVLSVADARLEHVDLTGAQLGGVDRADGLRGATLDEGQLTALAPQLADALGVRRAAERRPSRLEES